MYELVAHPSRPPRSVTKVTASWLKQTEHWLRIRWRVDGSAALVLPPIATRARADELWTTTCFELFLGHSGTDGYTEINLSPSTRWAAYDFDGVRAGMRNREMPRSPVGTIRPGRAFTLYDADIPRAGLPDCDRVGITAVIEEDGGTKSYWALEHRKGVPDFHDPACFAARLPPPDKP
ncbi:DOMON-like domain-containing protein [Qipengyuania sp. JC766]|uniref:DOMON-like domain-containing protein n=1 Tax=Qipengyuania sp. JC766 TaxID=3232139 RepID=UPI00345A8574